MNTPSYEILCDIWRQMVDRVKHESNCAITDCSHDDDPPSYFESEIVRQYLEPEGTPDGKANS